MYLYILLCPCYSILPQQHRNVLSFIILDHLQNLYRGSQGDLSISFFSESSEEECKWDIVLETERSLERLVSAIKEPWEAEFGVDLQVNLVDSTEIS